jgi:hypothetical protein
VEPLLLRPRDLAPARVGPGNDRWHPVVTAEGRPVLRGDERTLWAGRCEVGEDRFTPEQDDLDPVWRLPSLADVVVTDQRVMFTCAAWNVGGGYSSIGAPLTAAVMNVASKAAAAARRRGTVVVGQMRWEWLAHVQVLWGSSTAGGRLRRASSVPGTVSLLTKAFRVPGYPALRLSGGDLGDDASLRRMAGLVLGAVAEHHLGHDADLGLVDAERDRLRRMAAEARSDPPGPTGGGGFRLAIPGSLLLWFLSKDEYQSPDAASILRGEDR